MEIESGWAALAERIREELGRRRVTRQWLADEARISLSTLEKALAGQRPFTTGTLVRIEAALGLALRSRETAKENRSGDVAPDSLGAYSHPAVRWLEGDYLTLRPSFGTAQAIYAYRTTITWDEAGSHLVFSEADRADAAHRQRGDVALPHQSGDIYLVTQESGQYRLAILNRPTIDGALCGLLTTLQDAGGSRLVPVSCPILLLPIAGGATPHYGVFRPGEEFHADFAAALERVEAEGFARLVSAK